MEINTILIGPIITEQSMGQASKGKFTFSVAKQADKTGIKQAIEKKFNVHVVGVSTVTTKGRTKRVGARRIEKRLSPLKKAVVTLKKGEKIDLFDTGEKK